MNEILKTNEELVQLYKDARILTINELLNKKSSRKRILAIQSMWLKDNSSKGCSRCLSTQNLTVDHIVPCSILEQFGLEPDLVYMPQNYDVLCKRCNWFKADRLDFANPKDVAPS